MTVLGPTLTVIEGEGAVSGNRSRPASINGISYPCNNVLKVGDPSANERNGRRISGFSCRCSVAAVLHI